LSDNDLSWGKFEYGELLETWPRGGDGEPEAPAFLTHCSCVDMDDELTVSMLDSFGIPCVRQYGSSAKVVLGMSAMGADIYVPKSLLADARALLEGDSEGDAQDNEQL